MINPMIATAVGMVLFMVLLVCGAPICIGLGLGAIIGLFLAEGTKGFIILGSISFSHMYSFSLLAVPVFVLMGNLILHHKIGEDLYDSVYKWVGSIKGGLAMAASITGALFGFMCGSTTAGAVTVGSVSLPEMYKRRYDRRLSLGTVACSGGLSALIPPSAMMIIYCVIAESSMGRLFIAGILPGLTLTALMIVYIYLRVTFNPKLAPVSPPFRWRDRIRGLVYLVPVMVLFVTIIGGIYLGIWTATEAGAVAVFIVLLLCLAYRRLRWNRVKTALLATVKTCVMIYMLIIGASILAHLFFVSGITPKIEATVLSLALPPWGVVLLMMLIMLPLGMFLDVVALFLVCVPIFLPIILSLGYNDTWFGVLMLVAGEMALLTPPVGVNLFVVHGLASKDGATLMDVAWGSAPFVGLYLILCLLLIAYPSLALWLPAMMRG